MTPKYENDDFHDELRDELDYLAEELIQDILETSDEDVLKEAIEEGEDIESVTGHLRGVIQKTISDACKEKMKATQNSLKEFRAEKSSKIYRLPLKAKNRMLDQLRSNDSYLNEKITLAARNEKNGNLADSDLNNIIEDLIDLGLIDENGKPKCKG